MIFISPVSSLVANLVNFKPIDTRPMPKLISNKTNRSQKISKAINISPLREQQKEMKDSEKKRGTFDSYIKRPRWKTCST